MLKQNRSLDRGLLVLETVARNRAMSLAEIHRATGLPKSTLRRLLATLISRRFVRRSMADQLYRATAGLPDSSIGPAPAGQALFADVALAHALEMTRRLGWPSDIQLFEGTWLRVVESTRPASPFTLHGVRIDLRVNLFGSAAGLACLSRMEVHRVKNLFEALEADPHIGADFQPRRFGLTWEAVDAHLEATRQAGYGARLPNFTGERATYDNLSAIALPLSREGEICGAISLLWPRALMPAEDFAAKYLADFTATAAQIEADLDKFAAETRAPIRDPERPT
jgi:IclR family mhp operon transcriptional activator